MAKKSRGASVAGERSTKPIDLYAIIHRRLTVVFHGVRLTGRVVAAGWKTPLVVYRGDRTPLQFTVIAPDGTPTASSASARSISSKASASMASSERSPTTVISGVGLFAIGGPLLLGPLTSPLGLGSAQQDQQRLTLGFVVFDAFFDFSSIKPLN